jgi:aminoglycoside phosphotransferase (APT) family kinase protein
VAFYPVAKDPKCLLAGYGINEITPVDRRSGTDWSRIFFARGEQGREYVVRLTCKDSTSLRERALEHATSALLADHGIGPEIYDSFPADGVLLMERLHPAVFDQRYDGHILRLGDLIARLHAVDISTLPGLPAIAFKYSGAWARLEAVLAHTNKFPMHQAALGAWRELHEQLEGSVSNAVLCHNDIHIRNVLAATSGGLALIDNDHCSLGSGLYDLAAAVISFKLSQDSEEILLRRCGAAVNGALFHEYKRLVHLTYACMVFSFIDDYDALDTDTVPGIDPSGGFGKLPAEMSRDKRLFAQSCAYLRVVEHSSGTTRRPV